MSARPSAAATAVLVTLLALVVAAATPPLRGHRRGHTLRVATYNIWNVMFNWEVRKHHIAAMVHSADVDVVAFQEVRADRDEKRTQLLELKALLPSYKWHAYHPVQTVIPHKAPAGWEMEGLGILSRYPIVATSLQPLTHQSPKDKNQRTVLHASLQLGLGLNVSLAAVHLSYDHWQQCVNVAEIMKHVRGTKCKHSIILGDFNTYTDYPWPLEGLLQGYFSTTNKCPKYAARKNPTLEKELVSYTDAWAEVNPNKNGFTFSNMPQPGFQSRPDRILFSSKTWRVHTCQLHGRGEAYAKTYTLRITWNRLLNLLSAAEYAFYATTTMPSNCLHDCGPHGSCRCSICVSGGDKNRCEVPNCRECSANVYRNYLIIKVLCIILFAQFLVSLVLLVLHWRARRKQAPVLSSGSSSLIYSCCGFGHCCCAAPKVPRSRLCIVHSLRFIWPVLYMRPSYQLFICGVCYVLLFVLCLHLFEDSLRVIYAVLPEELNPSDHLMVVATAEAL